MFFELQKFDFSVKRQLNSPKKIYLIDSVFNELGLNFSMNRGKILENIVFIELKRRNKEVYYYAAKKECDFVVKEGNKIKEAMQVCYVLNESNKDREIGGLLETMEKFKLKDGSILTHEQEEEININRKKIKVVPVWKWLIN